jgi:hypothetical protein
MAAETVAIKFIELRYQLGTQRIQMDIRDQFQKVGVLLAENGLVPVLKQVAASPVPAVETHGVSRQKPLHNGCNGSQPGAHKQMEMIGHQGPGQAARLTLAENVPQPVKKIIAVGIVAENRTPLDSSHDDMVQNTRSIQSGFAWHAFQIAAERSKVK